MELARDIRAVGYEEPGLSLFESDPIPPSLPPSNVLSLQISALFAFLCK